MSKVLTLASATIAALVFASAASAAPTMLLAAAGPYGVSASVLRDLQPAQRSVEQHNGNPAERDLMIAVCRTGRVAITSTQACVNAYTSLSEEMLCTWQRQHDTLPASAEPRACPRQRQP